MSTPVADENIVAEIRMPDTKGDTCLTFVLNKSGQVRCWPDFGDAVIIDPEKLQDVANALSQLTSLCVFELKLDTTTTFTVTPGNYTGTAP
jgi:hypothetical protein